MRISLTAGNRHFGAFAKGWVLGLLALIIISGCHKTEIKPVKTPVDTTRPGLSFASLFQSNMVVQRDKPVTIWGQGPAMVSVSLAVSWNSQKFTTTTNASGNWSLTLPAAATNANPQTINITAPGCKPATLTNVLLGDVWLCSGQSNMVMPLDSIAPFEGVLNFRSEIAAANYPNIRMMTVTEDNEPSPLSKLAYPVSWSVCSPATAGPESAVAYYFAQKLNTTLNVPIGIIVSAVNGSSCQDWTNVAAIQSNSVLVQRYLSGSSGYYNAMINPLTGLALKGCIWYQGENNEHDTPSNYTLLNSALIAGWRGKFNQGDLPFYYTQLTPFDENYNSTKPPGGDSSMDYLALFREAQAKIRTGVNATGMAVTMDVGEVINHHPRNKKPVGERLALLALNGAYGQNVPILGPQYASFSTNQYKVTVNFKAGTADGLSTLNNAPLAQHFYVAGTDQVFRWSPAVIVGNTVVITAPSSTPLPVQAVRYAFTDAPVTNLQNAAGLPAEPFRTDNWDE